MLLVNEATIVVLVYAETDLDQHMNEFGQINLTTGLHFFQYIKEEIRQSLQNIKSVVQRFSQNPFFDKRHRHISTKIRRYQTIKIDETDQHQILKVI